MIPVHAAMELEQLERLLCKAIGHDAAHVDADPVATFWLCLRCRKFARTLEELR